MSPIDTTLGRIQDDMQDRLKRIASTNELSAHLAALLVAVDVLAAEVRVLRTVLENQREAQ